MQCRLVLAELPLTLVVFANDGLSLISVPSFRVGQREKRDPC
jgi:hypothetical protein